MAQQGGPFSPAQFKGNYAFGIARATGGVAAAGQIASDGIGAFVGNEDLFENGLNPDVPFTGPWTFGTNGRGTGTLFTTGSFTSTNGLIFYPITPSEIIFASDGSIGLAEKQCSDCH